LAAALVAVCMGATTITEVKLRRERTTAVGVLEDTPYMDFSSDVERIMLEFPFTIVGSLLSIQIKLGEVVAVAYDFPTNTPDYTGGPFAEDDQVGFSVDDLTTPTKGVLTFETPNFKYEGMYTVSVTSDEAVPENTATAELEVTAIRYCDSDVTNVRASASVETCSITVLEAGCPAGYIYGIPHVAEVHLTDADKLVVADSLPLVNLGPHVPEDGTFKFGLDVNADAHIFTVNGSTPKGVLFHYNYQHGEGGGDIGDDTILNTAHKDVEFTEFDTFGCADWREFCVDNTKPLPPLAGVSGLHKDLVCKVEGVKEKAAEKCRGIELVPEADDDTPGTLTFFCKEGTTLTWTELLPGKPESKVMQCGADDMAWVDIDPSTKGKWPYCYSESEAAGGASSLSISLGFSALMALVAKAIA